MLLPPLLLLLPPLLSASALDAHVVHAVPACGGPVPGLLLSARTHMQVVKLTLLPSSSLQLGYNVLAYVCLRLRKPRYMPLKVAKPSAEPLQPLQ